MVSLSKLYFKCNECKYKDECMELPPKARADMQSPILEPIIEPMVREYTPITIYTGENCTISTSLEEIHKQLEERFYINIRRGLNKTL